MIRISAPSAETTVVVSTFTAALLVLINIWIIIKNQDSSK